MHRLNRYLLISAILVSLFLCVSSGDPTTVNEQSKTGYSRTILKPILDKLSIFSLIGGAILGLVTSIWKYFKKEDKAGTTPQDKPENEQLWETLLKVSVGMMVVPLFYFVLQGYMLLISLGMVCLSLVGFGIYWLKTGEVDTLKEQTTTSKV